MSPRPATSPVPPRTHARRARRPAGAAGSVGPPLGPNDRCPSAPVSIAVALADKIDTLVGFFSIDEKPTGSKDPYALRRAALGVIRLVLENNLRLPLLKVFGRAEWSYQESEGGVLGKSTIPDLLDFFADRLKVHLREQGVRHDLIAAVFALGNEDDLVRLLARVAALDAFLKTEDGANLLVAYRSEEHTSELQSLAYLVCRLLLEKKKKKKNYLIYIKKKKKTKKNKKT